MILETFLSRLQGQRGGQAPDCFGLRNSRVTLLPEAEDSVWEKQETRRTGQGV